MTRIPWGEIAFHLGRLTLLLVGREERCPQTCVALRALQAGFAAEDGRLDQRRRPQAPPLGQPQAPPRRPGPTPAGTYWERGRHRIKLLLQQVRRLRRHNHRLKGALDQHTKSKNGSEKNCISEEWISRVMLTAPHCSCRALQEAFHTALGMDAQVICRALNASRGRVGRGGGRREADGGPRGADTGEQTETEGGAEGGQSFP